MENSSKALLIAAAVLIVILLIAFGIKIFNSPKDTIADAETVGESISSVTDDVVQQLGSKFDTQKELPSSGGTSSGTIDSGSSDTSGDVIQGPTVNEEITESTIVTNNTNQPIQIADDNGATFYLPVGYSVVRNESTNNKVVVNEGVVITDAIDSEGKSFGNEWVWVPADVNQISEVVDGKNVGKLYNFTSSGANPKAFSTTEYEVEIYSNTIWDYPEETWVEYDNEFKAQLQAEFNSMLESVKKYGGYYIGRYETGGSTSNPAVQKEKVVLNKHGNGDEWTSLYEGSKKLAANTNVTTGMIWGCQWDNTLRWLVSSGNKTWSEIVNSKEWGNINTNKKETTGASEDWKAGNIYDLLGNALELTLTYDTLNYSYVVRGGSCYKNEDFSVSYSTANFTFYATYRATLMINV